jgi:O-antigen ligase
MSFHSLMQQRTGFGFGGAQPLMVYKPLENVWQARSQFFGIFSDPNDLAQFLATCIPLVFAIPLRLNPLNRIVGCGVTWFLITALLATHSRGGMVALAAAIGAMLFLMLPPRWMPFAAALALVAGLALCATAGRTMLDESAAERVEFWGYANRAFKNNPLFGVGYGMFTEVTDRSRAAHNAFVLCYTELGLCGYWFWFTTLQLGIIGCWRTRMALRRPKTLAQDYMRRVSGLAIAAMAGFCGGAYFLSRAYVFPLFFLFGLLCAIPVIAQRLLPEDHPPLLDVKKDVLVAGTIGTGASVLYIYASILILNTVIHG